MMPAVRDAAAEVTTELQARLSMGLANSPMHGARIRVVSGNVLVARPLGILDGVDYGYTGSVRRVDTDAIEHAHAGEAVVLVPPLGYSPTGETFNLLSEGVATALAVELRAHKLLFLGDGAVLEDDAGRRIGNLSPTEAARHLAALRERGDVAEAALGRLEAALRACRNGVERVHLLDAHRRGALALELYSRDGVGTLISADAYDDVRRATIEDIGGILELIEPLEREGVLVRRSRPDIERSIGDYFVEQRDGAIVACAAAHPVREAALVELACLAVRDDYRDSGRGEKMLAAVETEARRMGATQLFVLTTQTTHWFRERGFVETEVDALPVERRRLYNWQRRSKVLLKVL
jgi:amino-acid N-acetyltransferase